MQELSLKDIIKTLKKRWWIIVAFCILVTGAAGFYFQQQPDVYTAQATLSVLLVYMDSLQQTRFEINASEQLANYFMVLINTPAILDKAIEKMGIERAEFYSVSINANVTNTFFIRVSASGRNRQLCKDVANTVSEVFIEHIQILMEKNVVKVVEAATLPSRANGMTTMKKTLLAGAVSLMLIIGILLVIELLNTTLRSADAVENTLGLPVLAGIQNYKKELERFLHNRLPGEMLSRGIPFMTKENVKALVTNMQFASIANPIRTLLVTSSTAGEGKSSLLLLISEAFADLGKRVLVVDMDMRNPSIGQYLGARGRNDLFDYLVGHSRVEEAICKTSNPDIHFIDSRHRLVSVSQIVNFEVFDKFLDTVKRAYDVILFDTPPLGLFIDAAALANKMDASLLVIGCGMSDRTVIKDVAEQLRKANSNILGAALNYVEHPRARKHFYGSKRAYGAEKTDQTTINKKTAQEM